MKRDMDLIRAMLIETEKADGPLDAEHFIDSEHTERQIAYHVELLSEHGLVDANVRIDKFYNVYKCEIIALTWDGSDFLEAVRDNTVWGKTKKAIKESAGSTTLRVVKEIAEFTASTAAKAYISSQFGVM